MSDSKGIFFDEWQACLRAHYVYVMRAEDTVTEPTLRNVLLQTGLTEADLDALRAQAYTLGPLSEDDDSVPAGSVPEEIDYDDEIIDLGELGQV